MNASDSVVERARSMARGDKALLLACFSAALIALALGVLFGAGTAAARAGFIDVHPLAGYRLMTQHGVTIFFYWLYLAQAGLLLTFAASQAAGQATVALRWLGWTGLAAMVAGLALSEIGIAGGLPLLYDAPPELAAVASPPVAAFYGGYLLLGAGLFCVAAAAVATVLARSPGTRVPLTAVGFAVIAWAGLLMVSAVAAFNAFVPAARWALGFGPLPEHYSTAWHVLFHNMHYLPLMATVLTWYVIIKAITGVGSIFGERFSKIVFASYLLFVPPTSLYHMFLEPDLAAPVRAAGSLLSLFISVPTVLVFLVIVASLETHARARGARGLFGWVRALPWRDPAMAAIGMAVLSLAAGGSLSFVLIQEQLAPLLSDTFFVPAYFHFLTVGTVTLSFLGALCHLLPALAGRPLWRPLVLARLPYVIFAGVAMFGVSGVTAGYLGVPRRMLDVGFGGEAPAIWSTLMAGTAIGGAVMAAALLLYLYGLARTLLPGARRGAVGAGGTMVDWSGASIHLERAWLGPLSVVILVAVMAVLTALSFEIMNSLPLAASGRIGH